MTTIQPADADGRSAAGLPPTDFGPVATPQPYVAYPPHVPAQRFGPYDQSAGMYPPPAPPTMMAGPPEPSLFRRHLGAILVAATILLVGAAGIVTRAATDGATTTAAAPSSGAPSQAGSRDNSASGGSSSSTGNTLSSADQRFVSVLQNGGLPITSVNQQDFMTVGHNVCGMLAQGYTIPPMITFLTSQKGYSDSQAATFVGASIGAYCPQYTPTGGTG